jgi:Flp pilus assembly protein TadG
MNRDTGINGANARLSGALRRLRGDVSGNVLAMSAAAIFPMLGLVGGAVDMGRLYSVKTRLQAACDAGALAGRRTMGAGLWSANSGRANTIAQRTFDLNFKQGMFGTTARTRTFTETDGTVTGTVTATVPMTLMAVFGKTAITETATCNSLMRIPNTDVMFVLDITGSMNCEVARAGYTCPGGDNGGTEAAAAKIKGLRTATKCFYEALAKLDTTETCPGPAPSGGLSANIQLRFGFVPYSVNVNAGKLLPSSYFVDSAAYQSRTPNLTNVWTWALGSTSAITGWNNDWTPTAPPTTPYHTRQSTSSWTNQTSGVTTLQGFKPAQATPATSTTCSSTYNTLAGSSSQLTGLTETGGSTNNVLLSTTNNPPVHPASQQVLSYNQTRQFTVRQWRYIWESRSGVNGCYLEWRNHTTAYNKTQTGGTATRPINWTERTKFVDWTYQQTTLDVSDLKSGSGWKSAGLIPNMTTTTVGSYTESGSSTAVSHSMPTALSVTWDGCIDERPTFRNLDGNPYDEWDPIPAAAKDMDIDLVPDTGDDTTRWRPLLDDVVWGRSSGSYTLSPVTTNSAMSRNYSYRCGTEAKKLQVWSTPSNFETYVNGLAPGGNTYHDIGMLWGARFVSPTGIFASENATTPLGAQIARHIVFMTDGDTAASQTNLSAYGVHWWDRRQTETSTAPSSTLIQDVINARTTAICNYVKSNLNTTLWVVSYGGGVNATTENRLRACASSAAHFFSASDTNALITSFQEIAAQISRLRLTS